MEGVPGVVRDRQTDPAGPDRAEFRRLMMGEVNAAAEGALKGGADEVVVSDGHWLCDNLLPEELHPRAELVSGFPRRLYMGLGLESGFDAAFFVGYHASAGTAGAVLAHTYADPNLVLGVRLNGSLQSEGSLNGYLCGHFGVPVALFAGDSLAVEEMRTFAPRAEMVVTKEPMGRQAARSAHPLISRRRISEGACRALGRLREISPTRLSGGVEIEVDFVSPAMSDSCERVPGVERRAARTVAYRSNDYLAVYELFLVLVDLAEAAA